MEQSDSVGMETMARSLGFGSARHFRMILKGERNLTVDSVFKIARHQKLSLLEHQYFEALVHQDQSEDSLVQAYYREIARSLKAKSPHSQKVQNKKLQDFSELFLPAIALLAHEKQKNSALYNQISTALRLEPEVVKNIIHHALIHSFLEIDDKQKLKLTATHIVIKDLDRFSLQIQNYILRQLEITAQAVKTQYKKGGKFFCNTLSLDPQSFELFEAKLRSLFEEIVNFSDEHPGPAVYQLNLQTFRLDYVKK